MIDQAYLDKVRTRITTLEAELSDPVTASDRARFQKCSSEHTYLKRMEACAELFFHLRKQMKDNDALLQDTELDEELRELAEAEHEELAARLAEAEQTLRVALLPPNSNDGRNTIMEIRAGTGGDEAGLFAGDLFRLYSRYAEQKGWKVQVIDNNPTPLGGYKEIVFLIEGADVYKKLQYESGGHRVQRIPATESSGRIHTSAATVAVLPEADDIDEIEIKSEDLRVDTYRASGAGGQHVNKTDSAVRITHLPSGVVVQSQDERSQHRNKEKCMRVLKARLLDAKNQEEAAKMATSRRTQIGSGDRSERIRTYNFPQNRMTDHRIHLTLYNLDRLMEGDLDELVTTLHDKDIELRLQEQLEASTGC